MTTRSLVLRLVSLLFFCQTSSMQAQVDYGKDNPWNQRAESGPDAEVPGWFYNLGITGLRAQLVPDEPAALLIKYVSGPHVPTLTCPALMLRPCFLSIIPTATVCPRPFSR